jgi:methionyl-tRNA formyltransferase
VKFAYAGTPDFAAWVLAHLLETGNSPSLVLTQPSRPKGRGRKPAPPPVVAVAHGAGIPCLQTDNINSAEVAERIDSSGVETLVVAAFGQILKPYLLERCLCLNVHASLLPAYRGAAPIERALAAGELITGVSIMRMVERLDEGPWALQTSLSIGLRDDAGSVARNLAMLGANGVDQALRGAQAANLEWTEQHGPVSYAAKISARDGVLDLSRRSLDAHNQVRALSATGGVRAQIGETGVKIWGSWPYGGAGPVASASAAQSVQDRRGALVAEQGRLFVGCGSGALELLVVQPAGRNRMSAADFLRGYGSRLGEMVVSTAADPES